jgi:hypothetical protein
MASQTELEQCPGWYAFFIPSNMGTDRYRGGCSGCWVVCNQILPKEYQDYPDYQKAHRLTVDTYILKLSGHGQKVFMKHGVNVMPLSRMLLILF